MPKCSVDQSLERKSINGFTFPLGVYPIEELQPRSGYTSAFEPADDGSQSPSPSSPTPPGMGEEAVWEEWPDRYVFDILVPATRVESLCRTLMAMLPGRIYPILDFLGQDEWREVDPYVSYDLLGLDRFLETTRRFRGFFYEDGLVGFGAMSEEPFLYVFVDEHKVVTVRAESALKEKVESVLAAFDIEPVEELASADSVTHEHRSVLEAPDDQPALVNAEEIVEMLRDDWRLVLNIDPETNIDEDGRDLGITGWRCIVRYDPPIIPPPESIAKDEDDPDSESTQSGDDESESADAEQESPIARPATSGESAKTAIRVDPSRYLEVYLTADSYSRAADLCLEALEAMLEREGVSLEADFTPEPLLVQTDRWNETDFSNAVKQLSKQSPDMAEIALLHADWLSEPETGKPAE